MKDLNRLIVRCLISVVFTMLAVHSTSAQATHADCDPIYQKFLDNRKGPKLDKYKIALAAGNEYISKCSALEGQEEIKTFVTKHIPTVAERVKEIELINRFNDSVQARNWEDAMSSGKQLLASNHAASLDIMIALASIGYTSAMATPPVDKYNSDAISYAKTVIQKLDGGATSETYGIFQFSYKTKGCTDGKLNAISWMNYVIGSITYERLKQKSEAIPYLFKAEQSGCELKGYPEAYRLIGAWYTQDAVELLTSRAQKIKAAGDKETEETKADGALINGYLERAMNAYARAYRSADANKAVSQAYKDSLYKKLQDIFDSRYDDKHDGMDKFIADVMNSPFPDPSTPVKPVVDTPVAQPTPAPPPKQPKSTKKTKVRYKKSKFQ